MLTGCVQSVFFPQVNASTARVLAAEGCDVIIPRNQGCCGALSLHSGREAEAAAFARQTIAMFEQAGVDAIVVNSAGCGSAMKEYEAAARRGRALRCGRGLGRAGGGDERQGPGLGGVPGRARTDRAAAPAAGHGRLPRRLPPGARPADHPAAAGAAARDPRTPNLVELPDAGTCCGSAGVYNLLQPEAASRARRRKADSVLAAGAPLLISANPGCSLQIAAALAERGEHVAVAHTAEILDASIRGLPPD
jgi:glycolate oxidase iron-sulfur subunit